MTFSTASVAEGGREDVPDRAYLANNLMMLL